jgi:uncharacterized protein DUF4149
MRPTASAIELVILSAWLGAAIIVAAAVAPAAFAVLPSRTLAGALVGQVLPVVFLSGIVVAVIAIVCEMQLPGGVLQLKVAAPLAGLILGCGIAQFVIGPRIERVRQAIAGPVDALALSDPRRVQFGSLHGFSVMWMGVAMLSVVIAIALKIFSAPRTA